MEPATRRGRLQHAAYRYDGVPTLLRLPTPRILTLWMLPQIGWTLLLLVLLLVPNILMWRQSGDLITAPWVVGRQVCNNGRNVAAHSAISSQLRGLKTLGRTSDDVREGGDRGLGAKHSRHTTDMMTAGRRSVSQRCA